MSILVIGITAKNIQFKLLNNQANLNDVNLESTLSSRLICDFWTGNKNTFTFKDVNFINIKTVYLLTCTAEKKPSVYFAIKQLQKQYSFKLINKKILNSNMYTPLQEFYLQKTHNLPMPKTFVINHINSLKKIKQHLTYPIILKAFGKGTDSQGRGVFKFSNYKDLSKCVLKYQKQVNHFQVREFIPHDFDIRVFCVGYKAIGAMARYPKKGDFKANISQGAIGKKFDLNSNLKVKGLAEKIAKLTKTEVAGVDIVINKETGKPYILEVNDGPQIKGISKYTDVNVAEDIINYLK